MSVELEVEVEVLEVAGQLAARPLHRHDHLLGDIHRFRSQQDGLHLAHPNDRERIGCACVVLPASGRETSPKSQ
jgi:hypothetical protein